MPEENFDLPNDNQPNEFIVINSFDQFTNHTIELAKLITSYYQNLHLIKNVDLKNSLVLHFQQSLIGLGLLGIGQTPYIDDNNE